VISAQDIAASRLPVVASQRASNDVAGAAKYLCLPSAPIWEHRVISAYDPRVGLDPFPTKPMHDVHQTAALFLCRRWLIGIGALLPANSSVQLGLAQ